MTGEDEEYRLKTHHTETENVILRRRSVRIFKKKQVPEFMIKRICEAGRFAPSAGNYQPWKFVVVRQPQIIEGLTETVVKNSRMLNMLLDYRRPGFSWLRPLAELVIRGNKNELHPTPFGALALVANGKLDLFHGAPSVIIIFKDVRGVSNPDLDCGIAGQNMVLAAHSMGLGSCWVGFTKLAFERTQKWKKFFDIKFPYRFVGSIAIGYPNGDPDGEVERQTHGIDWYENNTKKTIF